MNKVTEAARIFHVPDLHMHSSCSDGSNTPAELLEKVRRAGLDVFALTDHDAILGCAEIRSLLRQGDPVFVSGVEFSCKRPDGEKCHVLGYGFREAGSAVADAVAKTHAARKEKLEGRLRFLRENYGFVLPEESVRLLRKVNNPGKPHIVRELLRCGFLADGDDGYKLLSGYEGNEFALTPYEAIDVILASGGIPVLAHGIHGEGDAHFTEDEITVRVRDLKAHGLMGLECFYSTYSTEEKRIMLKLAASEDMLVTAGSDYHGEAKKNIFLGMTNEPVPELMQPFADAVLACPGISIPGSGE